MKVWKGKFRNMAKTNWKKLANKDYLGAWDIEQGSDLVLTKTS